jgi:hypothetical protein
MRARFQSLSITHHSLPKYQLFISYRHLPGLVAQLHTRGIQTIALGVNDDKALDLCLGFGLPIKFMSDRPQWLRDALAERGMSLSVKKTA